MTNTYTPNKEVIDQIVDSCQRDLWRCLDAHDGPLTLTSPEEYNPPVGCFAFLVKRDRKEQMLWYKKNGLELPIENVARYDALCEVMKYLSEGLQKKGYAPILELKPLAENCLQRLANLHGLPCRLSGGYQTLPADTLPPSGI